jgi:hypothetical protein
MKLRKLIGLLSILFILINPVLALCVENENMSIATLRPGKGIGNINIGDKLEDVVKKMGKKPSEGKTVTAGNNVQYWLIYKPQGLTFVFDRNSALVSIIVTNPVMRIPNSNIRINSSSKELNSAYGDGRSAVINDNYEQRIYDKKGMNFMINKGSGKVETITIMPKTDN